MVGRLRQDEFRVNTDEGCGKLQVERFAQTKLEGGLSIPKMLSGANVFENSDVQDDEIARRS
jgi:hypothetical protein